jgi:hypothetical protein
MSDAASPRFRARRIFRDFVPSLGASAVTATAAIFIRAVAPEHMRFCPDHRIESFWVFRPNDKALSERNESAS